MSDVTPDNNSQRDKFVVEVKEKHHKALLLYAMGTCHRFRLDPVEVDDLVQDLYIELMIKWPASQVGYEEKGLGFLCKIVSFDAKDLLRRKKSERRREELYSLSFPEKVNIHYFRLKALTADFYQQMKQILKVIEYEIMMQYMEGYAYQEIAEILDIPRNTVGTKIRRAKKRLKKALLFAENEK
ncbi:MAG: RNA polymerase sigma factor [Saprospiraceae bacterium]